LSILYDEATDGEATKLMTRRELIAALWCRYTEGNREAKKKILDEFVQVSGYHRKHAIRLLGHESRHARESVTRGRRYGEATVQALTVLWKAADRICGKRLKALPPVLIEAMERHGYLQLDPEVRSRLLGISAATIDRLLRDAREKGKQRRSGVPSPLRKAIPVRTFGDWKDPAPGQSSSISGIAISSTPRAKRIWLRSASRISGGTDLAMGRNIKPWRGFCTNRSHRPIRHIEPERSRLAPPIA
jgi:hypothetical protein